MRSRLTTQAQRPGPRDATIATVTRWPGSLQRMVRHQPRHTLIVVVETVATNRLTAAAWARLKVTTDLMQSTARYSAVVTLRMIQIVRTLTVRHAVKLLTADEEVYRINLRLFVAVPSGLFGIPRHALMSNDQAQRPPPETPVRLQQSLTNYLNRSTAQRGGGSLQR